MVYNAVGSVGSMFVNRKIFFDGVVCKIGWMFVW